MLKFIMLAKGIYLGQFRRKTTSGDYLPEIDGLRFLAITSVFFVHLHGIWQVNVHRKYVEVSTFEQLLAKVFSLGGYGVELFFIISGFVLAIPFCKSYLNNAHPVDVRKYTIRRLTRLEPPYVISLLLFYAAMPFVGKGDYWSLLPHLLASLAYVHNVIYDQGSLINNNAWSLEIEIQFYILVPVFLMALAWQPSSRRSCFFIAFLILSFGNFFIPMSWPKTIANFAQYFLAGVIICELWISDWRTVRRKLIFDCLGILSVLLFFVLHLAGPKNLAISFSALTLSGLVIAALRGRILAAVLSWSWIPIIGGMCYSIYLIHARIMSLLLHGVMSRVPLPGVYWADMLILTLVCFPAVVAGSALFFLLVERPCMDPDWPAKLTRRIRVLLMPRSPDPFSIPVIEKEGGTREKPNM